MLLRDSHWRRQTQLPANTSPFHRFPNASQHILVTLMNSFVSSVILTLLKGYPLPRSAIHHSCPRENLNFQYCYKVLHYKMKQPCHAFPHHFLSFPYRRYWPEKIEPVEQYIIPDTYVLVVLKLIHHMPTAGHPGQEEEEEEE